MLILLLDALIHAGNMLEGTAYSCAECQMHPISEIGAFQGNSTACILHPCA